VNVCVCVMYVCVCVCVCVYVVNVCIHCANRSCIYIYIYKRLALGFFVPGKPRVRIANSSAGSDSFKDRPDAHVDDDEAHEHEEGAGEVGSVDRGEVACDVCKCM